MGLITEEFGVNTEEFGVITTEEFGVKKESLQDYYVLVIIRNKYIEIP